MHFGITEKPMTDCISLYNNTGLISKVFEKIASENAENCLSRQLHCRLTLLRLIGWKLRIFPTPLSFNPPRSGWTLSNLWMIFLSRKSPWAILSVGEDFVILRRFRWVPGCDGQTDGRTDKQLDIPTMTNTGLAYAYSYADALLKILNS